jgi:hypothetical protein
MGVSQALSVCLLGPLCDQLVGPWVGEKAVGSSRALPVATGCCVSPMFFHLSLK